MKFALVNGIKKEAQKGLVGICPACGEEVIAKCGKIKINHWAHKTKHSCDVWVENETFWHRKWKNNFPEQWQEKIFYDNLNSEKHIADICTDDNLVIEFQHSSIKPEERESRENFYKNIIWVVDGTRLKNDYERFSKGYFKLVGKIGEPTIFLCLNPQKTLPPSWQNSKVPVFFDFTGLEEISDYNNPKFYMFCLLPNRFNNQTIIIRMTKQTFIYNVKNNAISKYLKDIMAEIDNKQAEFNKLQVEQQKQPMIPQNYFSFRKYTPRRKFHF